ncbi:MAG TPA: GNAT family N-acetyltransferase [Firmicutes bacterium]|jgi:ribosomal protein S18 acetylase RimI-like enzyme|nr:GNAT family N-acetyltransferase [Bacillota bacterium]HBE06223.1 GNAT family N-acetyltransferase [Bacillota bacterium]HBL49992.1 GNAT family N-acetyltransferase [Bacillota bacterium]HCF91644.1 GNAT family N-acetyltransferase [Bacillota bacterium]HCM18273.1 GNAT family N-acetyltransferase [Bacillota bacterium]
MKYTLRKNLTVPVKTYSKWAVEELNLEGIELIEVLRELLSNVMEGILDPEIAGKKPDGYLNNLRNNRLGDFSKRYIIAALDNDRAIGLLIGLPEENQKLHIYTLGVLATYRKTGVGSILLAKCINDMFERDMDEIILDVHSDNVPAFNLFKKFGFH